MAICFSRRARAAEHVMTQEVEGELVLLSLTGERYFGLDETGSAMWREVTTAPSIEAAYERLLAGYDVAPEKLRSDLGDFLARLLEHDLIQIDD